VLLIASSSFADTSDCTFRLGLSEHAPTYPSFEEYLQKYSLSYEGQELQRREDAYTTALQRVKAQNAKQGRTWQATVNELTVLTPAEMQSFFGKAKYLRGPSRGAGGPQRKHVSRNTTGAAPPRDLDWREHRPIVVTAVKSQGHCGSCWAFATAAVLESRIAIATGALFSLSPQQIVSCTPNPNKCGGSGGCDGAIEKLAFNYVKQHGILSEWTYPYTSGLAGANGECFPLQRPRTPVAGIRGFAGVPPNLAPSLIEAVQDGPVTASVAANKWGPYETGIFPRADCDWIINHAVVLMGYGEQNCVSYWLIRNSWGPTWGEHGYIRLERAHNPHDEQCGWDTEPMEGSGCVTPPDGSNPPTREWVCGTCGVLSDSSYPTEPFLGAPVEPADPALSTPGPSLASLSAHVFAGVPDGADGAAFLQTPEL